MTANKQILQTKCEGGGETENPTKTQENQSNRILTKFRPKIKEWYINKI